jgi:hypothetical protein
MERDDQSICQIYGSGVPAPPVYVTIAKLSAQQPSRGSPAKVNVIDQPEDQGKPRQAYLDDSQNLSVAHIV